MTSDCKNMTRRGRNDFAPNTLRSRDRRAAPMTEVLQIRPVDDIRSSIRTCVDVFLACSEALRGSRSHIPGFKDKGPPSTGLPGSPPSLQTTSCICSTARVLRIVCCIARRSYRIPCIPRPSTSTVRSQMRLANFARSTARKYSRSRTAGCPRSLKHQYVPSSVEAPPIEPPSHGRLTVAAVSSHVLRAPIINGLRAQARLVPTVPSSLSSLRPPSTMPSLSRHTISQHDVRNCGRYLSIESPRNLANVRAFSLSKDKRAKPRHTDR